MNIAILGGGHGCYAAAADLSEAGHEVRLWRRDSAALQAVIDAGSITLKDRAGSREVRIARAGVNIGDALRGAELVLIPSPATAQADIARANAPITLEVGKGLSNVQWSVAMARTSVANSATSQFFINLVDNSAFLDPSSFSAGYAVFGSVTAGTAVAAAIVGAPCAAIPNFSECAPNPNVVITSAVQTQ